MGVLRSGARGNMPATAKRLASWRVLKEMLQSFLRRCSLLDVLESLTVGTCVQHFFQVLSRGGGSLAQVFACPGHNVFFPCPILRFACPVFVDKCSSLLPFSSRTIPSVWSTVQMTIYPDAIWVYLCFMKWKRIGFNSKIQKLALS